jgi:cell filamentation protein
MTDEKKLSPEERQKLEAYYSIKRTFELELQPVRGNFDAAHLKEIHRRIFQDFESEGLTDIKAGEYRAPVPENSEWIKQRGLSTQASTYVVAYSRMDNKAIERLDKALEGAKRDQLRNLKTAEFTAQIAKVYAEADYVHPFTDGNSRTLRIFTKQLASEAGFEIEWQRFNTSEQSRDTLYVARDRSVNALALPQLTAEHHIKKLIQSKAITNQFEDKRDLANVLRDVVRPQRAIAFEQLPADQALKAHPELADAFKTLRQADKYFEEKLPGNAEAKKRAVGEIAQRVQQQLNQGEISNFAASREAPKSELPQPIRGLDRDR